MFLKYTWKGRNYLRQYQIYRHYDSDRKKANDSSVKPKLTLSDDLASPDEGKGGKDWQDKGWV